MLRGIKKLAGSFPTKERFEYLLENVIGPCIGIIFVLSMVIGAVYFLCSTIKNDLEREINDSQYNDLEEISKQQNLAWNNFLQEKMADNKITVSELIELNNKWTELKEIEKRQNRFKDLNTLED